jgi:protocatechuate 3,4-dioxygenase alpha subunit
MTTPGPLHAAPTGQTPSQTVGPFFAYALTPGQYGYAFAPLAGPDLADEATPGARIILEGQVLDGAGEPITDAMVEIWQADSEGRRGPAEGANAGFTGFGRCGTGTIEGGLFRFTTIRPGAAPGEAPHIDVALTMRGLLNHAFTRVYFESDPRNGSDPVLLAVPADRRATLIARETAPRRFRFDIRMQGEAETVFFDL